MVEHYRIVKLLITNYKFQNKLIKENEIIRLLSLNKSIYYLFESLLRILLFLRFVFKRQTKSVVNWACACVYSTMNYKIENCVDLSFP